MGLQHCDFVLLVFPSFRDVMLSILVPRSSSISHTVSPPSISLCLRVHVSLAGRYIRDICIYGLEDLQWIVNRNSMFANKFESGNFPVALDCLELWHRNKVLQQASVPIEPSWLLATLGNGTVSTSGLSNATAGL